MINKMLMILRTGVFDPTLQPPISSNLMRVKGAPRGGGSSNARLADPIRRRRENVLTDGHERAMDEKDGRVRDAFIKCH